MTFAFSPSTTSEPAPAALVVDAVRCWREATDRQSPVLPILFARLETRQAGFLAPAISALLTMLEAWSGRRFRAGDAGASHLTEDERQLLALLDRPTPPITRAARPSLTSPLRIALRSTRIILRKVLGQEIPQPSAPDASTPIFFGPAQDRPSEAPDPASPTQKAA